MAEVTGVDEVGASRGTSIVVVVKDFAVVAEKTAVVDMFA